MPSQQPTITSARGTRQFACSAAAVLVCVVNSSEQILLLSHPRRPGTWEVVNGALEAQETIMDGVLRELHEEIGPDVRARPLGTVHTWTFAYDTAVQYMISVCYLLAYEGGAIAPGNDMVGSAIRWRNLDELEDDQVYLLVPRGQKWILRRAIELYRLWHGQAPLLQPPIDPTAQPKDVGFHRQEGG